jgi:molecular chaperone GrpE
MTTPKHEKEIEQTIDAEMEQEIEDTLDSQDSQEELKKEESAEVVGSAALLEAEERAKDNWERLLRSQAELDNIKRRSEKDIANAHKFSLEKMIKELLPVVDSLEMALTGQPKEGGADFRGVELTYKMFVNVLEKQGVKQLNPVGEAFNPHEHEAVNTQVAVDKDPDTVLAVMQKGYSLYDRLVRPAMVTVSTK